MYKRAHHKALFKHYMVNSTRSNDVFTETPFYLEEGYEKWMRYYSESINNISLKILNGIEYDFRDYYDYIDDFPLKERLFKLKNKITQMLWSRFDTFIKEEEEDISNKLFFVELNYDKPCGEREIEEMREAYLHNNNVNNEFKEALINNIYTLCNKYTREDKKINIAFLTDSTKYEETHLGLLIKEWIDNHKINVIPVGINNLFVEDDTLYAFEKENEIKVIIRLFPSEFLHEIRNIEEILDLFEKDKIMIINDPRIIAIQCKKLFSYLWKLVNEDDARLNSEEKEIVRLVIPYTEELKEDNLNEIITNRKDWVIKPVYGRYSIDVFIGEMHTEEGWLEAIDYVKERMKEKPFIIQRFNKIKKEKIPFCDGDFTYQIDGYGNYGTFLVGDKLKGICSRWNTTYLTEDETTWITPIVKKHNCIRVEKSNISFSELYKNAVINYGFSGAFIKNYRYLNTNIMVINNDKFEELVKLTCMLVEIFKKTQELIIKHKKDYAEIFSINNMIDFINVDYDVFTFLGRLDFVLDINNKFKVLEINSETPAGICESYYIDKYFHNKINKYRLINKDIDENIAITLSKVIDYYKYRDINIETVAVVGSSYYEDIYTFNAIGDIIKKNTNIKVISGCIYDIKNINGDAYLYGDKIDAIYGYYPLEWIVEEEELSALKKLLLKGKLISLNHGNTIISQSKAFFAAIWEFMKFDFYTVEEKITIEESIPYTTFDFERIIEKTNDFLVKPLLEREGNGIILSRELQDIPDYDCIFQENCLIQSKGIEVIDYRGQKWKEKLFPVLGVYISDDRFAGIYTRMGGEITNNICMYLPTFVE